MVFTKEKKTRALELHHQDVPTKIVADRLGVSYSTISNWLKKNDLNPISVCDGISFNRLKNKRKYTDIDLKKS